jgi:hypothetical protein
MDGWVLHLQMNCNMSQTIYRLTGSWSLGIITGTLVLSVIVRCSSTTVPPDGGHTVRCVPAVSSWHSTEGSSYLLFMLEQRNEQYRGDTQNLSQFAKNSKHEGSNRNIKWVRLFFDNKILS